MASLTYYAAFVPGMQDTVADIVRERLADVSIIKLLDGAAIFKTECTYDKLNFFCFNNIFAVIDILEQKGSAKHSAGPGFIETHMKKILALGEGRSGKKDLSIDARSLISENNKKIQSFRLVCSMENALIPVNENIKQAMEKFIARNSGLKLSRAKPDTEFWFLTRREGFSCFMKRLTNNRQGEKSLHPGELSPQLAWLLCHIAGLKHGDIAIDPFCGYGSIPKAACKHFPLEKFYAFDIDPQAIKIARSQAALKGKEVCEIRQADFRAVFDFVSPGKADAIVTDPPWGMYKETDVPLQTLYDEMLEVFSQLLKNKGRAVVLSAAEKELETAVEKNQAFSISRKLSILVSGKKAKVFALEKN